MNTCTWKAFAPSKCFQLLGSFKAPNQEFKLEKVQLVSSSETEQLTSASYDNRISCLVPELTAVCVRVAVQGEPVFICFSLILVSMGHDSYCKAVQLGGINARTLLQQVS